MSHQGHMGFYADTTDITGSAIYDDVDGITAISMLPVVTYGKTGRPGLNILGFSYDDITAVASAFHNDNVITILGTITDPRKLVVQSNLIPYMWSSIRNLADRVYQLENP